MKALPYIIVGALGLGAVALFVIRPKIEPRFWIVRGDNIKKEGVFDFGGTENSYSLNSAVSVLGRNGYSLTASNKNGTIFFDLYKDGKFIKTLRTI